MQNEGGFDASDTWRNNISGSGALIKKGTGSLTLEGANSYKGGTFIKDARLSLPIKMPWDLAILS